MPGTSTFGTSLSTIGDFGIGTDSGLPSSPICSLNVLIAPFIVYRSTTNLFSSSRSLPFSFFVDPCLDMMNRASCSSFAFYCIKKSFNTAWSVRLFLPNSSPG